MPDTAKIRELIGAGKSDKAIEGAGFGSEAEASVIRRAIREEKIAALLETTTLSDANIAVELRKAEKDVYPEEVWLKRTTMEALVAKCRGRQARRR